KFREVDKFWNAIENEEFNIEKKGLQLDELRMAHVIAQGASKVAAAVMENVDAKLIKTTQDPSTFASSTSCNDETEEQDEQIEIDLVNIKKQLEMEPLIEWKVGNINVTRRFRQYQRSVIDKVISYGLKWSDSYEILDNVELKNQIFTNHEWDHVTRTNPYVILHPVIPPSVSTVLREVAMMHLMGKESYMQSDESKLSKAVARTFNDLCVIPTHSPNKISEELHYDNGTKKRPDFSCVVDDVPMLNSEIKPFGVTLLGKKKGFSKVHLKAKKSVNQQLNLKGGPEEAGLLINMGDEVESFFMNFNMDYTARGLSIGP
ncbi:10861_t:CDS:2, partial [Cetraspora pellucida]